MILTNPHVNKTMSTIIVTRSQVNFDKPQFTQYLVKKYIIILRSHKLAQLKSSIY